MGMVRYKKIDRAAAIACIQVGTDVYFEPSKNGPMVRLTGSSVVNEFFSTEEYFVDFPPPLKTEFVATIERGELTTDFSPEWEGKNVRVIIEEIVT